MKDKYLFALFFHKPRFPLFPSCELALAISPPFLRWFVFGNDLSNIENSYKKASPRVVPTKHDVYSYRGHIYEYIGHVEVLSKIIDGGASRLVGLNFSPFISLALTVSHFFIVVSLRKSMRDIVDASDQPSQASKLILAPYF